MVVHAQMVSMDSLVIVQMGSVELRVIPVSEKIT